MYISFFGLSNATRAYKILDQYMQWKFRFSFLFKNISTVIQTIYSEYSCKYDKIALIFKH